ncbi:hypothetical protein [Sphingomonas aerolata]|uniref:hypothetical protein n=1 Tax=Sphingomonas aerolata TaxID=185951 RepID=UPI0033453ADC
MTNPNDYTDANYSTTTAVRGLIAHEQADWGKARGYTALANMIAGGYVAIQRILQNASAVDQALILDEHEVTPAGTGVSKFTPWIKVIWGERHIDKTKKFTDLHAVERVSWVPDRSMEVYHHTMEELERLGINQNHAAKIIEHGGALKMAEDRKSRLRKEDTGATAKATRQRDLFLQEVTKHEIELPFDVPADAAEFMTLLVRKSNDRFDVLGIADANASSVVGRMAKAQYDTLLAARDLRKDEQRREEEALARMADAVADAGDTLHGKTREERMTMIRRIAAEQKAKLAATAEC